MTTTRTKVTKTLTEDQKLALVGDTVRAASKWVERYNTADSKPVSPKYEQSFRSKAKKLLKVVLGKEPNDSEINFISPYPPSPAPAPAAAPATSVVDPEAAPVS